MSSKVVAATAQAAGSESHRRAALRASAAKTPVLDTGLDDAFVSRTYRSVAAMAVAAALFAWRWGASWASVPVLVGAALALALLYGGQKGLAQFGQIGKQGVSLKSGLRAFFWFTVIKCLLAWGVLWWLARTWDLRQIAALAGGISLVATNITLRVIGRLMVGPKNL